MQTPPMAAMIGLAGNCLERCAITVLQVRLGQRRFGRIELADVGAAGEGLGRADQHDGRNLGVGQGLIDGRRRCRLRSS
jgi:hypothetical protein